ncbi:hypothetical protein DFH06DRAFT_1155121 [Mycena polygramma]|nr:hypothetical protein DFH06DRAFT_1155121 [Mycena polygramma]
MDIDENTPTRVEQLWFSDGGLVVQAEQSLFRVSSGILAARSLVFQDMLLLNQPPDAETIEGCPVVRLPDSAADVTCFFRAIFDSSFFEPYPSCAALDVVISILHLSNKYAVDYLLRRALVHLSSDFPTTLAGQLADGDIDVARLSSITDVAEPHNAIIASIQIAREVNALWLLPSAFYDLASTDAVVMDQVLNSVAHNRSPAKLSRDDQILFLKTSLQISCQGLQVVRFLSTPRSITGCQRERKCIRTRMDVLAQAQDHIIGGCSAHPLGIFSAQMDAKLLDGCCTICHGFCTKAYQEGREAVWDKLPEFCGLPPWPELEEMKASALKA